MPSSRAISVTLSDDLVKMIDAKVASGEYASENEVVVEGLIGLKARDIALERWLREEAAASYDEYKADPSIAISADEVSARLDARVASRLARPKPL
jgi:Arc/MetJ-type ribon-helix-helix transcriptional regulator